MNEYEIFFTDVNGDRIGQVDDYTRLELVLRFNNVGRYTLQVPAESRAARWATWLGGIQVRRNGERLFSGRLRKIRRVLTRSSHQLEITGPDENTILSERIVYPERAGNFSSQAHDVSTGAAETVMKYFASANAGPLALAARQAVTIETDAGRGSTITGRGRFQNLLEFEKALSLQGTSEVGFRVLNREFQVYEPADLRQSIIFSTELGTLTQYEYTVEAAKYNWLICGAAGEMEDRIVREIGDSESIQRYGRIESFRDRRDTSNEDEIQQTLREDLATNAQRLSVSLEIAESARMQPLVDWHLGDLVTAVVDGEVIQERIREITIRVDGNGETITPTIGTPDAVNALSDIFGHIYDNTRRLERRLSNLEVR